jgi:tRNA 2-selenouridine synthase
MTPPILLVEDFLEASGPILDVRSPGEYAQAHIPGAISLPLFSDAERAEIGTLYKQRGRGPAVRRGLALVGPRLEALAADLQRLADAAGGQPLRLHCWRGGMRSGSVAWLAGTLELPVLLLEGGYKRFRRWALELFEQPSASAAGPWSCSSSPGRCGCWGGAPAAARPSCCSLCSGVAWR